MTSLSAKHSIFVFIRAQLSAQFATIADFCLTYICFQWLGIHYLLATSVGTVTGGLINCIINYKWAFNTQDCQFKWVLFKYILVWCGSFALNVGGLYLLVELLKTHTGLWEQSESFYLILSKIIVSAFVSIGWNYILHRHFVFRDAHIQSRIKSLIKKDKK